MNDYTRCDPISLAESSVDVIQLFNWGPVRHPKKAFVVDREFAKEMIRSFKALAKDRYFPPLIADHGRGHEPGTALGLVKDVFINAEGIAARVEYAKGVEQEVRDGKRPYTSPSFYGVYEHPHTGEKLKFALRELSFATIPVQRNIQPLGDYYSLSETGWVTLNEQEPSMADENAPAPETAPIENEEMPSPEDFMEKVSEAMTSVMARLDAIEAAMDPEPEDEPTENSEDLLRNELAELRRELAVSKEEVNVRSVLPDATMDEVTALSETLVSAPGTGKMMLALAERAYKAEAERSTVQSPIGPQGNPEPGPLSFGEAFDAIANEQGTEDPDVVMPIFEKRHPELAGVTVNF